MQSRSFCFDVGVLYERKETENGASGAAYYIVNDRTPRLYWKTPVTNLEYSAVACVRLFPSPSFGKEKEKNC